jgi:hypothetical protein
VVHVTHSGREQSGAGMSSGGPISLSNRPQSAADLRELATRARRFASWLAPLDPSRPKLLAYADELDARAATLDTHGEHPNGAD